MSNFGQWKKSGSLLLLKSGLIIRLKKKEKKANRARKDLTFVPGNEIMDLNNERRSQKECIPQGQAGDGSLSNY